MAKRNPEPTFVSDKAKVRVFFAEVEGNNDSVQEALKTMVSAMSRPVRVVSDAKPDGKPGALPPQSDAEEIVDGISDTEESDEAELLVEEPGFSNGRRPRGSGKKKDRNDGLALVPNLNFRPNGQQTLREFVDAKNPKNDLESVLVTIHFMQHAMNVPKIGPNHVMTAFKDIGKPIPVDLKQTIRNIASRKAWVNFDDIEDVRTTTQGENVVEHDMGKS